MDTESTLMRQRRVVAHLAGLLGISACSTGTMGRAAMPAAMAAADSAIRAAVANEQTIDAASFPPRAVGVAPFQVHSADSTLHPLGFGLADLLMTDLARSAQVQVVDRLRIDALLRELRLAQAGFVDTSSAARFGRLVGARRIVLGAMTTMDGGRARLDGRVGDVLTGAVEVTAGTPTTLDALLDAEKAFAFAVFDRLGVVLAPAERALVEQRPTRNLAALLAYSRGVQAEAQLDFAFARREYREAIRQDPGFDNAGENLNRLEADPAIGAAAGTDMIRAGALALQAVNAPTMPRVATAVDPAFRQPMVATIIIVLTFP